MTLIVGILCTDGVVLASDSAATYAQDSVPTIGQQHVTKVRKLGDGLLYASTGSIGTAQLISARLEEMWNAGAKDKIDVSSPTAAMQSISQALVKCTLHLLQAANAIIGLTSRDIAGGPVLCKSIVALPIKKKPSLFSFEYSGAPEQVTDEVPFVALGSGQNIADPFLAFLKRILWDKRQPTMGEGRFAAAWTIHHTERVVPGYVGGPIQMACLTMASSGPKIEMVDAGEHENRINAAEAKLRDHIMNPVSDVGPIPEIPVPEGNGSKT